MAGRADYLSALTMWFLEGSGRPVPADFVANDFGTIARAMRRETSSPLVVLHFWDMLTLLTSTHESVEAAVAKACALTDNYTAVPVCITATDGTVLMDGDTLSRAVVRYRKEGGQFRCR